MHNSVKTTILLPTTFLQRGIIFGDYENVSERNGAKDIFYGPVSRARTDTSSSVILHKREGPQEVRSYADLNRGNIGRPLDQ